MVNYLFLGTFSPTQISSHTHICFLFFIFFLGLFCHFKAAPTLVLKHCFVFFKNLPTTFLATHVYIPAEVKVSLNHQPWPSYDDTILTRSSYDLNTCIFWSHRANLMHIRNTGVRWCSYHHLGIKLNCGVNSPTEVIMRLFMPEIRQCPVKSNVVQGDFLRMLYLTSVPFSSSWYLREND